MYNRMILCATLFLVNPILHAMSAGADAEKAKQWITQNQASMTSGRKCNIVNQCKYAIQVKMGTNTITVPAKGAGMVSAPKDCTNATAAQLMITVPEISRIYGPVFKSSTPVSICNPTVPTDLYYYHVIGHDYKLTSYTKTGAHVSKDLLSKNGKIAKDVYKKFSKKQDDTVFFNNSSESFFVEYHEYDTKGTKSLKPQQAVVIPFMKLPAGSNFDVINKNHIKMYLDIGYQDADYADGICILYDGTKRKMEFYTKEGLHYINQQNVNFMTFRDA